LGIVDGVSYEETIAEGDCFTMVSDGMVERANAKGELFGFERTREIGVQPAAAFAQAAQSRGQNDDITVVICPEIRALTCYFGLRLRSASASPRSFERPAVSLFRISSSRPINATGSPSTSPAMRPSHASSNGTPAIEVIRSIRFGGMPSCTHMVRAAEIVRRDIEAAESKGPKRGYDCLAIGGHRPDQEIDVGREARMPVPCHGECAYHQILNSVRVE
jgi:stage II sporulation SpoE-like protein